MRTDDEVGSPAGIMPSASGVTMAPYSGDTRSSRKTRMPEAHASMSTVLLARRLTEGSVVDRATGSEPAAIRSLAVRRMIKVRVSIELLGVELYWLEVELYCTRTGMCQI